MKKVMLTLAATSLLVGSAFAEWDFDIHGAQIAKPRMALTQAQRATFLAGMELETSDPVVLSHPAAQASREVIQSLRTSAEALQIEAANQ